MGVAHGALDAARLPFRHLDGSYSPLVEPFMYPSVRSGREAAGVRDLRG
jgi:hypothetical protein